MATTTKLTYERIAELNESLPRVDVKGKQYSMVSGRIQAFRKLIPDGAITTEILSIDNNRVVMRATVADASGRVLATGTAFEERGASFINKTSYIENCETSAVGRALGMLGIGTESSVASAEEMSNAIAAQKAETENTMKKYAAIRAELLRIASKYSHRKLAEQACDLYGITSLKDICGEDAERCLEQFKRYDKEHENDAA
jgi:hypothetical protein